MNEFKGFPKMPRMSRDCIITEKIDGTNSQIHILELEGFSANDGLCVAQADGLAMYVGSRARWITPKDDNYGFAKWAVDHADDLFTLGPGRHFGEWWGSGIQRGYGLSEKRLSLFNTTRWETSALPSCAGVVPVLYKGLFTTQAVEQALVGLRERGSAAAPGFMKPEGVVCFHTAGSFGFKKTLEKDEVPKAIQTKDI